MKRYIGLSETTFKERYRNHIKDFNNIRYRNNTELTKHVWQLKESNKHFEIKWKILKRTNGTQHNGKCKLCLYEKLFIIDSIYDESLLNKRSELINKCRHQNKLLLTLFCDRDSIDTYSLCIYYALFNCCLHTPYDCAGMKPTVAYTSMF